MKNLRRLSPDSWTFVLALGLLVLIALANGVARGPCRRSFVTFAGWVQIISYFVVLLAVTKPLGLYMYKVFVGERTWLSPVLRPRKCFLIGRLGVDENEEQSWLRYALAVLLFSTAGILLVYALQRLQGDLPLNPADMPAR